MERYRLLAVINKFKDVSFMGVGHFLEAFLVLEEIQIKEYICRYHYIQYMDFILIKDAFV